MPSPVVETAAFELDGREPWPEDAQLFQPYEVEQILLPDNANCLAVQAFLRMLGLPFTVEMRWNAEWMSPGGRVPFVRARAFLAAELEGVSGLLAERGLLPPAPPAQRADTRAFSSTLHSVLYHAELYVCWLHEPTFRTVTAPRYSSVFPWPLGWLQTRSKRRAVLRRLRLFGWAERSLEQVVDEVDKCCRALTERLGDKDYFFGSKPCELDALVFGHVFALVTTELPCDLLAATVKKYPELLALAARIENTYFKKKSDSHLKILSHT